MCFLLHLVGDTWVRINPDPIGTIQRKWFWYFILKNASNPEGTVCPDDLQSLSSVKQCGTAFHSGAQKYTEACDFICKWKQRTNTLYVCSVGRFNAVLT